MGHREAAGFEVESGETNNKEHRVHECVNDEDNQVETSKDETTTVTPDMPPRTLLEGEWTGQASGSSSKPTARKTTSASCNHPDSDKDVETRNPTTLPEDPGDAMDDDTRHPDEPTEPPDDAESARV